MTDAALLAAIANSLQHAAEAAARTERSAPVVIANNTRVAQASLALLAMEDHVGTFAPWCRGFIPREPK